ncbi:MAG: hypothetical protein K8L97_04980 [Anaerolineae bacterium]|nr:hypothetical protein [Anaerolineae bacterium]
MSEQGYSVERELKEAVEMVSALVPYVYEDVVYGKIGMNMPPLTIGNLLFRLRRLKGLRDQISVLQASAVDQVEIQLELTRKEWGVAYSKKMIREAEVRLRELNAYFGECKDDPRLCANAYLPEAQRRTILHELLEAIPYGDLPQSGLETKVKSADSTLRRYVRPSKFVWSVALRDVYPQQTFWWLYSRPPQPGEDEPRD